MWVGMRYQLRHFVALMTRAFVRVDGPGYLPGISRRVHEYAGIYGVMGRAALDAEIKYIVVKACGGKMIVAVLDSGF